MNIKDIVKKYGGNMEILSEAMEEYDYFFKSEEIELVRSAQITGNMAKVVGELSQELERDEEVN